ncbi:thioredoxin domain-containing protein [Mycobacteroides abscessus subsp. abscessus]|nr:thioredoxin domain-containing protein [Mycobacteroides abscessus subsp. abscessus]
MACTGPDSELLGAARRFAPGGAVVVGGAEGSSTLLAGRGRVNGQDAAYVCRGQACDLPVTTAGDLAAALGAAV